MADNVKWIKFYLDTFDGNSFKRIKKAKIGGIDYRDKLTAVWFELLSLAGNCNHCGALIKENELPYQSLHDVGVMIDREESEIDLCMKFYLAEGMVEIIDDVYMLSNWSKYQNVNSLEKIRESNRVRTARYRERQKALASGCGENVECNVTCDDTVTSNDISISYSLISSNVPSPSNVSKSLERDNITVNNNIKERRKKQFVPPTLDEVKAYCQQRGNKVDAQRFFDYYESGKWTDREGKPVVNWKQKMIANWEKKAEEHEASKPQPIRPKYKKLD